MNIVRILGIVLAIHVVLAVLLIQPGCQSKPRPQPEATASSGGIGGPAERLEWDDTGFPAQVEQDRPRAAPTRPTDTARTRPAVDEPVLRPLPSGTASQPSATASAPRTNGGSSGVYTVQRGDSLSVIAQRHNVSLSALMSINNLNQNSVIRPGQELLIPAGGSSRPATSTAAAAPSASAPAGTTTYTVVSGDSLSVIAQRHGTTVANLRALNNLSSDVIRIGQTLVVPQRGSGGASTQNSGATNRQAQSSAGTAPAASNGPRHVVKAGETPGGIASHYGISVEALMSANNMSDPRRMRAGQELVIPGRSAPAASTATSAASIAPQPRTSAPAPRQVQILPSEEFLDDEFPIIPIIPENN